MVVTEPGYRKPPHVKLYFFGVPFDVVFPGHLTFAVAWYHRRPVLTTRRQSGRRSVAWRRDWGARTFAFYRGFWPDWDVHGRHPNESDIANGADPVTFTQFPPPLAE